MTNCGNVFICHRRRLLFLAGYRLSCLGGIETKRLYETGCLAVAGAALVIGIAVSGSRSVVGACAVVVASLFVVLILRPGRRQSLWPDSHRGRDPGVYCQSDADFQGGFYVLSKRDSPKSRRRAMNRSRTTFSFESLAVSKTRFSLSGIAPLLGLRPWHWHQCRRQISDRTQRFLLTEDEWSRIFLESGPFWRRLCGLARAFASCGSDCSA